MFNKKPERVEDHRAFLEEGVVLGNLKQIARSVTFEAPINMVDVGALGNETIGAFTYIGPSSEIKNTKIGRFCSIARNVAISPPEHPTDWVGSHPMQYNGLNWFNNNENWENFSSDEVWRGNSAITEIGNDVWIGRNVVIRRGIKIGDGAIIAANSFVNKDVEPYSVVGGQPARHLKFRFGCETRMALSKSLWWNWMPPKGVNMKYSDPDAFLKQFYALKESGELVPFNPKKYKLENNAGKYFAQRIEA